MDKLTDMRLWYELGDENINLYTNDVLQVPINTALLCPPISHFIKQEEDCKLKNIL